MPTLAVLIAFGVTRRVGEFAISKPAREALYTVVPREDRYKAKSFIDTVIYRGGDAFSGWLVGFCAASLGVSGIAFAALPVAGWMARGRASGSGASTATAWTPGIEFRHGWRPT